MNPGSRRLREREPRARRRTAQRVWRSGSPRSRHQTLRGRTQIPARSAETRGAAFSNLGNGFFMRADGWASC